MINFSFVEMPPNIEMLRYKKSISWALRNTSFINHRRSVGDTLLENNWWLLGKTRYERILYSSLYIWGQEKPNGNKKWELMSLVDDSLKISLPLPSGLEIWDIIYHLNLKDQYNLSKDDNRFRPPLKKLLTPLGEEWTVFLLMVFKVGYPKVKEIIGEPLAKGEINLQVARAALLKLHQWSLHQGSYVPSPTFINPQMMSDELISYIWKWRKTLFLLYGITPGEPIIWEPAKTSKVILSKTNLDFGLVYRTNGVINLRPRDTISLFINSVEEWEAQNENALS